MLLTLGIVLALAGPWLAQEAPQKNPFAADSRAIELGRVEFRMSCAGCHGLHATGGRSGPDLTRITFAAGDFDTELYRLIAKGVKVEELVIPDDIHDFLLWRNWKTVITASGDYFDRAFLRAGTSTQ